MSGPTAGDGEDEPKAHPPSARMLGATFELRQLLDRIEVFAGATE